MFKCLNSICALRKLCEIAGNRKQNIKVFENVKTSLAVKKKENPCTSLLCHIRPRRHRLYVHQYVSRKVR